METSPSTLPLVLGKKEEMTFCWALKKGERKSREVKLGRKKEVPAQRCTRRGWDFLGPGVETLAAQEPRFGTYLSGREEYTRAGCDLGPGHLSICQSVLPGLPRRRPSSFL